MAFKAGRISLQGKQPLDASPCDNPSVKRHWLVAYVLNIKLGLSRAYDVCIKRGLGHSDKSCRCSLN